MAVPAQTAAAQIERMSAEEEHVFVADGHFSF
jgi:hypothetical protein